MFYLLYRLPWFITHLLLGVMLAMGLRGLLGRDWLCHNSGQGIYRWWHRIAARSLGLEVLIRGKANRTATLMVANHISWLDIITISTSVATRFVAKQEVRHWPVIGALAALAGTLFINRNSRRSMVEAIDSLRLSMIKGMNVVIFPEATTTNGKRLGKFHQGLFESARLAQKVTQAIAIRYFINGEQDFEIVPYIDDDTFVMNLLRVMRTPRTQVQVSFLTPISAPSQSRTQLSALCRLLIERELIDAGETRNAA